MCVSRGWGILQGYRVRHTAAGRLRKETKMIQAVCFDLFDTLADAHRQPEPSESEILGIPPEEWGAAMWEEELCRDRGLGTVKTVREMIDRACENLPFPVPEEKRRAVETARCERLRMAVTQIDGQIVETVRRLKESGLKIGLISNADVCDRLYWNRSPVFPFFDDSIFSCDVGLLKPDPAIYLLSLSRLGVKPSDALFVGDGGSRELEGAKALGMGTVCTEYLVRHPARERKEILKSADYTVRQFRELADLVRR